MAVELTARAVNPREKDRAKQQRELKTQLDALRQAAPADGLGGATVPSSERI